MTIVVLLLMALLFGFMQYWLFGKWALSNVKYKRTLNVTECYAGDTIEMIEVIENRKFMPVFWLRAESTIDASLRFATEETLVIDMGKRTQHHKSLFTIGPYRRIRRTHRVVCARRGVYRIEQVALAAGDLFGLNEKSRPTAVGIGLVVYPNVVPMAELFLPSHGWQGDVTVRRWIVDDPFMVAGVREYAPGDPQKRIAWKATARTGKLQVYQHDYTAEQRLHVVLNVMDKETARDIVYNDAPIEKAIAYAATIMSEATARGVPFAFGHNGVHPDRPGEDVRVPPGGGRAHLMAILDEMARMELRCKLLFHDYLALESEFADGATRDYVLVTTHVSEPVEEQIAKLRREGHSVEVLLVDQETQEMEASAG